MQWFIIRVRRMLFGKITSLFCVWISVVLIVWMCLFVTNMEEDDIATRQLVNIKRMVITNLQSRRANESDNGGKLKNGVDLLKDNNHLEHIIGNKGDHMNASGIGNVHIPKNENMRTSTNSTDISLSHFYSSEISMVSALYDNLNKDGIANVCNEGVLERYRSACTPNGIDERMNLLNVVGFVVLLYC